MDEAAASWRYEQLHKDVPYHDGTFKSWARERSSSHPYHFRDGVRIWVAPEDLAPDDDFLGRPSHQGGADAEPDAEHQ